MNVVYDGFGLSHAAGDLQRRGVHGVSRIRDGLDVIEGTLGGLNSDGARLHVGGDVGSVFDDLGQPAGGIEDRVVARLDPDRSPTLAEALEHARRELTAAQAIPERRVIRRLRVARLHEHRVRSSPDLFDPVAERRQKVSIGVQDRRVGRELDHRLRPIDGRQLPHRIGDMQFLRGDVGSELYHLDRHPIPVPDRIVGSLDPDLAPALGDALELARAELSAAEIRPKLAIRSSLAFGQVHEQAVMAPHHLVMRVAYRGQEVGVGVQDRAVEGKFDHGLRPLQGFELPVMVDVAHHLCGDIGGEFNHPGHAPGAIKDRIVGGLDPDFAATFCKPLELACLRLAAAQGRPERAIGLAGLLRGGDEARVVLSLHLGQGVAH
ncbi:hypothetical protein CFIICLFH_2123 [Methylobacterium goesingense]|nr:hypothetical protein CFIICLFH_2123 [Methylobacterium goesingense]